MTGSFADKMAARSHAAAKAKFPGHGLPRRITKSVTVSIQLVEEKPTEVSVVPVGEMTRKTARDLAYAALAEAGIRVDGLDSNGFSPAGAFFGVRLPE